MLSPKVQKSCSNNVPVRMNELSVNSEANCKCYRNAMYSALRIAVLASSRWKFARLFVRPIDILAGVDD
jgi:hypothetical protein